MMKLIEEMDGLLEIKAILERHFKDLSLDRGIEISYYPNNQYEYKTFEAVMCVITGQDKVTVECTLISE